MHVLIRYFLQIEKIFNFDQVIRHNSFLNCISSLKMHLLLQIESDRAQIKKIKNLRQFPTKRWE